MKPFLRRNPIGSFSVLVTVEKCRTQRCEVQPVFWSLNSAYSAAEVPGKALVDLMKFFQALHTAEQLSPVETAVVMILKSKAGVP